MKFNRSSGVILHPTSLPGPYGIGDLGPQAYRWIDFLAEAGCSLWQILPLGPTGYGDSPYQCFSAFAGNPVLISPELLLAEGLILPGDLIDLPEFPGETGFGSHVDYGLVIHAKMRLLNRAFMRFQRVATPHLKTEFERFQVSQAGWVQDYGLFMALKDAHGGKPWYMWRAGLKTRQPSVLAAAREKYREPIQRQVFQQFIFFRQWGALRRYAHEQGIRIIGDVPIFVSHDSADVWANPHLFDLYKNGKPRVVAGVPPDYFSPTGQLWGNPLYRWEVHAHDGYRWWLDRLRSVFNKVDIVRLDHFRGFAGYWEVPAGKPTAEIGRWLPGPGAQFLRAIELEFGGLPIIAEDLGEITPDVFELRDQFNLPGMKILQFAFGGDPEEKFLPHNYSHNCVAYTGTHDNDTTLGWYKTAPENERDFCRRYLNRDGQDIVWDMIRCVWSSVAVFALVPMQDLLNLDTEARMNFPGRPSGNWCWRMSNEACSAELAARLREINFLYGRGQKQIASLN